MMGRCPQCGEYNTFQEQLLAKPSRQASPSFAPGRSVPKRLEEISTQDGDRTPLSIQEFNRVLGGGVVPGSISLIAGDPGIGKSTLLLQTAIQLAEQGIVLYVSGEESEAQIKMRAQRLIQSQNGGAGHLPQQLFLVTETSLEHILVHVEQLAPAFLVVDSIQTTYLAPLESSPGSISQVRECASNLRELAKSSGVAVFLIGHVTKEGAIAGPRVLEHIVDTVLYLEGDRFQSYRLLRCVKNRFGATSEVGVFEMRSNGMVEVPNPSEAFLAERMVSASGSAIAVTMEATRPLLVEVQGLTSPTSFGHPRRTGNGIDTNRLLLLTAVLTRHVGASLASQDVFVNVIGGLKIGEPAADLALAAAITSSMRDQPVRAGAVLIGEVGLSGELRSVSRMPARLNEAAKLGFSAAIVPKRAARQDQPWPKQLEIIEARTIQNALQHALVKD